MVVILHGGKGPDWQMRDTIGKEFFSHYTWIFLNHVNTFSIHDYLNKCKNNNKNVNSTIMGKT